jgi:ankyrin repeat protein
LAGLGLDRGVLNIVLKLIDKKADVGAMNASGTQPIHKAAIYGNAGIVKKLVECGVDANAADKEVRSPALSLEAVSHSSASRPSSADVWPISASAGQHGAPHGG